jgi:photosystem II stability/assembly factor-like uncharacterized protein
MAEARNRPRERRSQRGRICALFISAIVLLGFLANADEAASRQLPATPTTAGSPLMVDGDRIKDVFASFPEGTTIYAVGGQGLYRSDDGGASWRRVGDPPPARYLAVGGDGAALLFAGDHLACGENGQETPLHRSEDGGQHWQEVRGTAEVRPVAIYSERLALGESCGGVQLSTDGGQTWSLVRLPSTILHVMVTAAVSAAAPSALVVGTAETSASSVLWLLDLSDPAAPRFGAALRMFSGPGAVAGHGERLVLGTIVGVWVSDDNGATWDLSRDGLEDVTVSVDPTRERIPDSERQRGYGIGAVAIDPARPDHLYAGTVHGVFESIDVGRTWQVVPGVEGRVAALVLPAQGTQLIAVIKDGEEYAVTIQLP